MACSPADPVNWRNRLLCLKHRLRLHVNSFHIMLLVVSEVLCTLFDVPYITNGYATYIRLIDRCEGVLLTYLACAIDAAMTKQRTAFNLGHNLAASTNFFLASASTCVLSTTTLLENGESGIFELSALSRKLHAYLPSRRAACMTLMALSLLPPHRSLLATT